MIFRKKTSLPYGVCGQEKFQRSGWMDRTAYGVQAALRKSGRQVIGV